MELGWTTAAAVFGGLVALWAGLVVVLWIAARREAGRVDLRSMLRLVPDLLVLLRRLAGDRDLPRGVRWRLVGLLAYLALPVDLVPDFIPVVGYADDVVVVALVLRSVARRAGFDAVERHWPGDAAGLDAVRRLAGLVRNREAPGDARS